MTNAPAPRSFHAAFTWNNCIYILGGLGYQSDKIVNLNDFSCFGKSQKLPVTLPTQYSTYRKLIVLLYFPNYPWMYCDTG